jgi:hypothetical protein
MLLKSNWRAVLVIGTGVFKKDLGFNPLRPDNIVWTPPLKKGEEYCLL